MLLGCSSTRQIHLSSTVGLTELNNLAENKKARVTLNDGRQFDAYALFINTDSNLGSIRKTELSQTFDTRNIDEIRFTDGTKGAAVRFFCAAPPVGVIGLLAKSGDSEFKPSGSEVLRATIIFGLVGAAVGSAIQYKIKYRFIGPQNSGSLESQNEQ